MGHQRLGEVPKTRKWSAVVNRIAGKGTGAGATLTADVPMVAAKTLSATETGLNNAINDHGLRYTFYLLTQLVLSAREKNWQAGLKKLGIRLTANSSLIDLTSEVQRVIDLHVTDRGRATAVSEMAQKAAGEALASLTEHQTVSLFGGGREELQEAVKGLSTKAGFARLGQKFFGNLMARYLNFYISRITASQVGGDRLPDAINLTKFNDALRLHCHESARIVHDFCGEWYSKTEFETGIDEGNTSRFMAVAVKKLQSELRKQREAR